MIPILIAAVVIGGSVHAMYRRAHPAPTPARTRPSRPPGDPTVAVVHDTGSAVKNTDEMGFGDTTGAAARWREDSLDDAAIGRGLTTKQTYVAPLNPEPARRR